MNLEVDVAYIDVDCAPPEAEVRHWVSASLRGAQPEFDDCTGSIEVSVRIVGSAEMHTLNRTWRDVDAPTNVLSFPSGELPGDQFCHLGDIVVCAAVVHEESRKQKKPEQHHWAHMLVHGTLHLLGHDHIEDLEAERMETLEISILQHLDVPNPYRTDNPLGTLSGNE